MFKRLLLLLIVVSALAFGQSSTPLPVNFMGAGAMYNPGGKAPYTGWVTYAHLLDVKSATYFFTTEDVIPTKRPFTLQTSARVGFGTLLKEYGKLRLWAIVDGGGATTGTQSGGAAGGRTCATFPIKKDVYGVGCYGIVVSNIVPGTPKVYEAGLGKSW